MAELNIIDKLNESINQNLHVALTKAFSEMNTGQIKNLIFDPLNEIKEEMEAAKEVKGV